MPFRSRRHDTTDGLADDLRCTDIANVDQLRLCLSHLDDSIRPRGYALFK